MLYAPQTFVVAPIHPEGQGTVLSVRMSPLRSTYLTGCGADQRGEGKLNHCTFLFINGFIENNEQ
jgi:hypothetical protein